MKCEKCLYRKNCQFLAKHKKAVVEGCTAFASEADLKRETAKEIFEEIENALFNNHCVDDGTDCPTPHYFEELKDDIAALKKKYEVAKNDKG